MVKSPPEADGQWLLTLTGSGRHAPASHPPLVARVRDVLGPGALDWGVDVGHEMATTIIADITAMGGGEEAFDTLRMGTEASTLHSMLMLVSDDPTSGTVPEESLEGDRVFAQRRIPLDVVLHGIRVGHSIMARSLLDAASTMVEEPLRTQEMKRTSEWLFGYMDDFASTMSAEYLAEHDRWVTSAAAERAELVASILDGTPVRVADASTTLGYPLDRHHLALVVWRTPGSAETATDLQRVAAKLLADSGCSASLVVPFGASSVWVWTSWRSGDIERPQLVAPDLPGINVTVGTLAAGVDGFRQSHHEALQAAELVRGASSPTWLTWYDDVELAVLLSSDPALARAFVSRELGPLAADTAPAAELRETVATYLACDRSLAQAAEILHVARNTVAYRVKKVEKEIGRDLRDRRLEFECALRLTQSAGSVVLDS
ncbi:PucR family transcriptional regulator [Nocardioides jensenii]|uniref:PucR family transcriptional regulator n=1 Tax=Nocardioides jensenii TaxID=1843 RepID=UPI0008361A43|nr:helix-turn-helix domain-containing protein [Nocardioides jensenii]